MYAWYPCSRERRLKLGLNRPVGYELAMGLTVGSPVRARWRICCEDENEIPMIVEPGERGRVAIVHADCLTVAFEGGHRIWVYEKEVESIQLTRFEVMDDLLV